MASELSPELIQHLVEIGESQLFDDDEKLLSRFPLSRSGSLMRLAPQSWYEAAYSLGDAQLVSLIKALTVLEQHLPNFRAGSVSPVIWLFRKLSERSPDLTPVIDWVLSHTNNPYLPFGTNNLGAKSLAELYVLSARASEDTKARRSAEENRLLEAKTRKAAEATHKIFGALRRHDEKAVTALLAQGADIHAVNEQGQTALQCAQSVGFHHLLTTGPDEAVERDAPKAARPSL